MSIPYNNTTTKGGLVQLYEREIGANYGDISGNTDLLRGFTADVNSVIDDFTDIAIKSSGTWQFDDNSAYETDGITEREYPIIYADLADGQRDYPFTTDENGNLILDIYRMLILPSATATEYQEIKPTDEVNEPSGITSESSITGIPYKYGKLANGIFLEYPSNYDATKGLKMLINRESSYFLYTDTTKKPGVPGIFHEYFALKPALKYAGRKSQSNYNDLLRRVTKMEGDERLRIVGTIQQYYQSREKDLDNRITMSPITYM